MNQNDLKVVCTWGITTYFLFKRFNIWMLTLFLIKIHQLSGHFSFSKLRNDPRAIFLDTTLHQPSETITFDVQTGRQEMMTNYWWRSCSITTNYHQIMLYPFPKKNHCDKFSQHTTGKHCFDCNKHLLHGPSWSYCCWIYSYLCNLCISPLKLWVRMLLMGRCTRYNIMS